MIDQDVPSTRLALVWPALVYAEGESASRVQLHRRVLQLGWEFSDCSVPDFVGRGVGGNDVEDENDEEEDEEGGGDVEDKEKDEEKNGDEGEDNEEYIISETERGLVYCWDMDISKARWPTGVKEISLTRFNLHVDNVAWPECLQVLSFHAPSRLYTGRAMEIMNKGIFDVPLGGVSFSAGLRELYLGARFKQRIETFHGPRDWSACLCLGSTNLLMASSGL